MRARRPRITGFTLVELLVTLALIGIAAAAVLPLASVVQQRSKEAELKMALITIRTALDKYKAAADAGVIDKPTGSSGYPPSLAVLVTGVPRSTAAGPGALPQVFLRRIPRNPFQEDASLPAEQTWNIRSYGAAEGDFRPGPDVFDVSPRTDRQALDGSPISEW